MAGGMDTAQIKNSATRDELMALLKQHKPDVVMLQETWLSGEPDADWLDEAGYVWEGKNRIVSRGTKFQGGCGILIHKSLAGKRKPKGYTNITRGADVQAGGHTGTVCVSLKLTAETHVNLITSYVEDATACNNKSRNLDITDIYAGLTSAVGSCAEGGLTIWGLDANAATADLVEFTEEDEAPPPPRLGSRFDDGQARPPNKHGRLFMEGLGRANMRAVHDRGLPGTSAVWQHTCARPIASYSKASHAAELAQETQHASPGESMKNYAHTVIDYIAVNTHALGMVTSATVRDIDAGAASAGTALSDHRMLTMTLDVGAAVERQNEAEAIAATPEPKLNIRKLDADPALRRSFQAELAGRVVQRGRCMAELAAGRAEPEPAAIEGHVAALTADILQSLEGTVGWVQVTGRKSVNGRANGWMADPEVKSAVQKKKECMRASEATLHNPAATRVEQGAARKKYTAARNGAASVTKKAKQQWMLKVLRDIERCDIADRDICNRAIDKGAATWKALKTLSNTHAKKRRIYPVLNKAAAMCDTPVSIANAHRENLAGLAAPISIEMDPAANSTRFANDATARATVEMVEALHSAQTGPVLGRARPGDVLANIKAAEKATPALASGSSKSWDKEMMKSIENMNKTITIGEVKKAIAKCARNTAPGNDGITYEVLQAMPDAAVHELTSIYNKMLRSHTMPPQWKDGEVSMLYKEKETDKCTNYRGLTLLCTMGKVFERVLLRRLTAHLDENKLLHENQIGFRADRCTQDHVFALQQSVEANPNCLALFVDVRKAYPTVFRDGLFAKLAQKGVTGDIWSTMRDMYTGLSSSVKVAGAASDKYPVETGLMEGAILSPLLYTVFIDDLARKFAESGLGCKVGRAWTGALYYADDLCLMANSHAEMQEMLDILDQYCRDWKFSPSFSKTKMLRFGTMRTGPQKDKQVYLPTMWHAPDCSCCADWGQCNSHDGCKHCSKCSGHNKCTCCAATIWDQGYKHSTIQRSTRGTVVNRTVRSIVRSNPVQIAKEYVYLGVCITDDAKFTAHIKQKVTAKVKSAAAQLYRYYATEYGLSPNLCAKLIQSLIEPNLRYCAAVWAPTVEPVANSQASWGITKTASDEATSAYTTAVRTALGTARHTKSRAIYEAMQLKMPLDIWQGETLQFWDRLRRMPPGRLARKVYEEAARSAANTFNMRVTAAHQAAFHSAPQWNQPPPGKLRFRVNVKRALKALGEKEWYDHIREHAADGAALYLQAPPPSRAPFLRKKRHGQYSEEGFNVLLGLRIHGHSLAALVGRNGIDHATVPLGDRTCPCCMALGVESVEDETHFVVKCPSTDPARSTMVSEITAQYPHFRTHYDAASDLGKTKLILWQIPDGEFPGAPAVGSTPDSARVVSTRAVLRYLRLATQNHPRLRLYNRPRS